LKTLELIAAVARAGSIRKAAEDVNLTASALNRRIQSFEAEFGWEIFERLPRGMRLNPAGELILRHFRTQTSDIARIQSQVADMSGERRGHVSIACSQALIPYFLPREISAYRREHPGVTFAVSVRDRAQAEKDLAEFNSDIALVYEPVHLVDFEVLHAIPQPVFAVFAPDHPLAQARGPVRLRDCLDHPCVLPALQLGVRHLLEMAARRIARPLSPVLETDSFELIRHYALHEAAVGFQIPIGLVRAGHGDLAFREVSSRDMPAGRLLLGQMKGRALPVASARFAVQLSAALGALGGEWAAQ
jgi:DNA-binding transcriptional LysR family regulator